MRTHTHTHSYRNECDVYLKSVVRTCVCVGCKCQCRCHLMVTILKLLEFFVVWYVKDLLNLSRRMRVHPHTHTHTPFVSYWLVFTQFIVQHDMLQNRGYSFKVIHKNPIPRARNSWKWPECDNIVGCVSVAVARHVIRSLICMMFCRIYSPLKLFWILFHFAVDTAFLFLQQ